jgi:hypothetical protein
MTLLKFDGFEGYTNPDDAVGTGSILSSIGNRDVWSFQTGRNGGKSLRYKANNVYDGQMMLNLPIISEDYEGTLGFAIKSNHHIENMSGASKALVKFGCDGFSHFRILQYPNGSWEFGALKGNDLIDPEIFNISADRWYYVEIKYRCHETLGVAQMRIDEQLVYDFSGDTLWQTNSNPPYSIKYNYITLSGNYQESEYSMELDDIYISDNQGSENNDFLGDIRIDTIHPDGAGNYAQMTPSVGNNYECVDEAEVDESDYVEGANAGEKDSYAYPDVPTDLDDTAIIGLQIRNFSKRTAEATNIKIDNLIRTGSTDYSQVAVDLPDAFGETRGDIVLDDPSDSNPWTQAKINACEFGMEVG